MSISVILFPRNLKGCVTLSQKLCKCMWLLFLYRIFFSTFSDLQEIRRNKVFVVALNSVSIHPCWDDMLNLFVLCGTLQVGWNKASFTFIATTAHISIPATHTHTPTNKHSWSIDTGLTLGLSTGLDLVSCDPLNPVSSLIITGNESQPIMVEIFSAY